MIIPQIIEELIFELNKTRKDFPLGGIESYNGIVDSYIKAEPINNLGQKNNNDSLSQRDMGSCAFSNNNLINMNLNGKVISIFLLLFNLIPFLDQSSGFININYPFVLSTSCLGFPFLLVYPMDAERKRMKRILKTLLISKLPQQINI